MSCWPTAEECSNYKLNLNLSPPLPSVQWKAFFCRNQLRSQLKAKIPEIGFYQDKKTRDPDGVGCAARMRTRYFASRCSSYYQDSDRLQHNLHTDTTNTDCCLIIINPPPLPSPALQILLRASCKILNFEWSTVVRKYWVVGCWRGEEWYNVVLSALCCVSSHHDPI